MSQQYGSPEWYISKNEEIYYSNIMMYDPIFILNKNDDSEKYVIKHQQGHVEVRDQNNKQIRKNNMNPIVLELIKQRYGQDIIII